MIVSIIEILRNGLTQLINANIVFEITTLFMVVQREKNLTGPELMFHAKQLGNASAQNLFETSEKAFAFF